MPRFLLLFSLLACHKRATVSDACDVDPSSYCVPCASDADCLFAGNDCTSSVLCAEKNAPIAVIEIGCEDVSTYAWPPDEDCACQDGECHYTGDW